MSGSNPRAYSSHRCVLGQAPFSFAWEIYARPAEYEVAGLYDRQGPGVLPVPRVSLLV